MSKFVALKNVYFVKFCLWFSFLELFSVMWTFLSELCHVQQGVVHLC